MKVSLDVSKFTLREVEDFEEVTGAPFAALQPGKPATAKQVRAILWINNRRADPDFTYEMTADIQVASLEFASPPAEAGPAATANGSRPSASTSAGARRKRSGV